MISNVKTLASLPRYTLVMLQFVIIGLLWARVEQVAIMADTAQTNANTAANWAQALAQQGGSNRRPPP